MTLIINRLKSNGMNKTIYLNAVPIKILQLFETEVKSHTLQLCRHAI